MAHTVLPAASGHAENMQQAMDQHVPHMQRAIALSERAGIHDKTGRCFGAVIVDADGNTIGEGYNQVGPQHQG